MQEKQAENHNFVLEKQPESIQAGKNESVHAILAHAYLVYFGGLILGILLDLFFSIRILPKEIASSFGIALIVIGPMIILWSQLTTLHIRNKVGKLTKDDFKRGPYLLTRHPTYLGLVSMIVGFGFIVNSVIIIGITILTALLTKYYFIRREESILAKKYGEDYLEYKRTTSSWL